jgi:zeta-carotene desaturase
VRAGAAARVAIGAGRVAGVRIRHDLVAAPLVIAAVPWHGFGALFDGMPAELEALAATAAAMRSSPIATVNLWFDRPAMEVPFVGLPGRVFQWAFDKRTVSDGRVTHVSLVCSSAADVVALSNEALVEIAHRELGAALPEVRRARLVRGTAVRERRATFSLEAGEPQRPGTDTALDGFILAGDWVDTGLPATIESAVISGHRAARAALAART